MWKLWDDDSWGKLVFMHGYSSTDSRHGKLHESGRCDSDRASHGKLRIHPRILSQSVASGKEGTRDDIGTRERGIRLNYVGEKAERKERHMRDIGQGRDMGDTLYGG